MARPIDRKFTYSIISTISLTGIVIIVVIGIFFEQELGVTTNKVLTYLEVLFLTAGITAEVLKRRTARNLKN